MLRLQSSSRLSFADASGADPGDCHLHTDPGKLDRGCYGYQGFEDVTSRYSGNQLTGYFPR